MKRSIMPHVFPAPRCREPNLLSKVIRAGALQRFIVNIPCLFCVGIFFMLTACGTLAPSVVYPVKPATSYAAYQRHGPLMVGVDPLTTKQELVHWFGADLSKNGLVALHVTIENDRESSERVVISKDQVALGQRIATEKKVGQTTLPPRDVTSAERAAAAAWGFLWAGVFGAVAFYYGVEEEHTRDQSVLQHRMWQVALRSETLNPGDSLRGFVYFRIQPQWTSQSALAFALRVNHVKSGQQSLFLIDLPEHKQPYLPNRD